MSIQEVVPEELAQLFYHYQNARTEDGNHSGIPDSKAWDRVSPEEKGRLVEAVRLALLELAAGVREREDKRRYFAKPGQAEWGC